MPAALSLASLDWMPPISTASPPSRELLAADGSAALAASAPRDEHKGRNGRVLCVGGDHGSGGAIMLCAEAALRSGAGLVDVATRERACRARCSRVCPEAMAHASSDTSGLRTLRWSAPM